MVERQSWVSNPGRCGRKAEILLTGPHMQAPSEVQKNVKQCCHEKSV